MRAILEEQGITVTTKDVLFAYESVEPAWNRLFSELADDKRVADETLRKLDQMIIKHLQVKVDLDDLASHVQQNWDRMDHQLPKNLVRRPHQDAAPCLETLAGRGLPMGIVSNSQSEERLRQELQNINLLHFFSVLIASGSVGIDKPSRGIFEWAANKIGVEPRRTMFIGDDLERLSRCERSRDETGLDRQEQEVRLAPFSEPNLIFDTNSRSDLAFFLLLCVLFQGLLFSDEYGS